MFKSPVWRGISLSSPQQERLLAFVHDFLELFLGLFHVISKLSIDVLFTL
jgi:hypothetical protein